MRTSALLLSTLKEVPADAEIPSHRLMLRAGLIRRVAALKMILLGMIVVLS